MYFNHSSALLHKQIPPDGATNEVLSGFTPLISGILMSKSWSFQDKNSFFITLAHVPDRHPLKRQLLYVFILLTCCIKIITQQSHLPRKIENFFQRNEAHLRRLDTFGHPERQPRWTEAQLPAPNTSHTNLRQAVAGSTDLSHFDSPKHAKYYRKLPRSECSFAYSSAMRLFRCFIKLRTFLCFSCWETGLIYCALKVVLRQFLQLSGFVDSSVQFFNSVHFVGKLTTRLCISTMQTVIVQQLATGIQQDLANVGNNYRASRNYSKNRQWGSSCNSWCVSWTAAADAGSHFPLVDGSTAGATGPSRADLSSCRTHWFSCIDCWVRHKLSVDPDTWLHSRYRQRMRLRHVVQQIHFWR